MSGRIRSAQIGHPVRIGGGDGGGVGDGAEQELETLDGMTMTRMQEAIGTDAVESARRDVLQKAAQEFGGRQLHLLALVVSAVAVAECDGGLVAGFDSFVGQGGAMDVTSEILEQHVGMGLDP